MYNSNMVIYYMNTLITTGRPPKDIRDPNSKTDYAKMKRLVSLEKYLKADVTESEAKSQWHEAEQQVKKYMSDDSLKRMTSGTQLHGIILQFKSGKLFELGEV